MNTVSIKDRYGNWYDLPIELVDYFHECQYNWSGESQSTHESGIIKEFVEYIVNRRTS